MGNSHSQINTGVRSREADESNPPLKSRSWQEQPPLSLPWAVNPSQREPANGGRDILKLKFATISRLFLTVP